MRKIAILCTALALGMFQAGCASQLPRTASAAKQNAAEEYVWYTPTGSHIPIRIRKSELTESENTRADQEAMREVTRKGLHMDRTGD